MPSIEKFCTAMRWAADSDRVGYSQSDRESLQEWGFFSDEDTNTDCSKLVIEALQYAGFDTGWATYTGNMSGALEANGWVRLPNDGDPQRGDILLNDADHVAVWLGDCLAQASIGEGGLVSGGERGDQTGWEVNTRGYYDYPWDCYLRYMGEQESEDDDMTPWENWSYKNQEVNGDKDAYALLTEIHRAVDGAASKDYPHAASLTYNNPRDGEGDAYALLIEVVEKVRDIDKRLRKIESR